MIDELYQMCQRDLANAFNRTMGNNRNAVMSVGEASIALTSSIQNEEAGLRFCVTLKLRERAEDERIEGV